ncbi:hypothetical protein BC940DRAFT_366585 [Gongronella butleri]|nr:hypothetical protein BC940DRAFT_366585 [Gongronella butleri]
MDSRQKINVEHTQDFCTVLSELETNYHELSRSIGRKERYNAAMQADQDEEINNILHDIVTMAAPNITVQGEPLDANELLRAPLDQSLSKEKHEANMEMRRMMDEMIVKRRTTRAELMPMIDTFEYKQSQDANAVRFIPIDTTDDEEDDGAVTNDELIETTRAEYEEALMLMKKLQE